MMQDLANSQKVVAVLGVGNTGVAQASYRYAQEAKVPFIITVSAGAPVNELFKDNPENYVFRISAGDPVQAGMIVREAVERRGFKKVAILADDTNYGQNGRVKMEAALEARGVKPVSVGKFKIKDTDMTPQLLSARDAGAEVLLCYGIGPELAQIANGMQRIGWKVPMICGWTASMSNFIDTAGAAGDGTIMPQTVIENGASGEKIKKFVADFKKKFNVDRLSFIGGSTHGYDALYIVCRAMDQAGTTEGPALKSALENLKKPYEGATTTFSPPFTPTDHEAIHEKDIVMGTISGGQILPANKP